MSERGDLYQCCIHCGINPATDVCWDLEEQGGHPYPCPETDCPEGHRIVRGEQP